MKGSSVSAVITHHESPDTLRQVLDALLLQDHALESVILVDNGSRQDLNWLEPAYPMVRLVRLPENSGLTHARNVGLSHASSEYVILLDDDVYPAPDCIRKLLLAATDTGAAAVCPRILLHPGDEVIQCDGASIHFAGMLSLNNRDAPLAASQARRRECGAFIGACLLIKRQLLLELGGFDEDYFFYFEDLELSYRLRGLGHTIWCEPAGVVLHDRGRGTPELSFRGEGPYPRRRVYFTLRHRWLTMILHYRIRSLLVLAPALALYDLAAFLECIRRGWLPEWTRASWSLLRELPRLLKRRQRWQDSRTTPDSRILEGGPLPFAAGFAATGFAARAANALSWMLDVHWKWAQPCL